MQFTGQSVNCHIALKAMFFLLNILVFVLYIYKHLQFNTMSCKQKGKSVKPQVLKLIYGSPLVMCILLQNRKVGEHWKANALSALPFVLT